MRGDGCTAFARFLLRAASYLALLSRTRKLLVAGGPLPRLGLRSIACGPGVGRVFLSTSSATLGDDGRRLPSRLIFVVGGRHRRQLSVIK